MEKMKKGKPPEYTLDLTQTIPKGDLKPGTMNKYWKYLCKQLDEDYNELLHVELFMHFHKGKIEKAIWFIQRQDFSGGAAVIHPEGKMTKWLQPLGKKIAGKFDMIHIFPDDYLHVQHTMGEGVGHGGADKDDKFFEQPKKYLDKMCRFNKKIFAA